jgi:uncharacterized protein (TIGR00645 family)
MPDAGRSTRRSGPQGWLEAGLFASRWLLAPFYVGLVAALLLLLVVFVQELVHGVPRALASPAQGIVLALSLIDLSLAANLTLIVTLSGYENFVSKIDTGPNVDRPPWMGAIDFGAMKMKLIASIVAISTVALLRTFMEIAESDPGHPVDQHALPWMVGLHLVFVVSGVMFALMDWLAAKAAGSHGPSGRG